MAAINPPRKHHYIPSFYLKHWVGADQKVVEFSRPYKEVMRQKKFPSETGFEYDLYSFNELPPDAAQFIEEYFLMYADDRANKALEKHLQVSTRPWTNELICAWSRFLIGMHVRHPDAMKELRPAAIANWERSGISTQIEYEKTRKPKDPPTFDEYWAMRDPLLPVKARVNMIIATFDNEILGNHFNRMPFAILDVSASAKRLLTSDRPLAFYGLNRPEGTISIPISPTRLYVAVNDESTFEKLRRFDTTTLVDEVNIQVTKRARRYVYGIDDAEAAMVTARMSTEMESTPLFPNVTDWPDSSG